MTQHLVNPELQAMALAKVAGRLDHFAKRAFVPGDVAAGGGGGDPMAGGGAPPMDPMAGGGAPPMDPMAGGGGGDPLAGLQPMIQQAVQDAMASQGGGGGGGGADGGVIKPKIDVNVELMQIKNMLAKMIDAMGITMPAQEMVATEQGLNEMAANPGADPSGGAGGSAIQPIQPMDAAAPPPKTAAINNGNGYTPSASDQLQSIGSSASSVIALLKRQGHL